MTGSAASELAHVLWIGGAPRCGKTTLSRLLAGKYDLRLYNLDWHQVREHRDRLDPARHPTSLWWERATMDQRWVLPGIDELVSRSIDSWTEMFELVIDDLVALPRTRPILAEGPGAFPSLVAPLLASERQALWLAPATAFLDDVLRRRRLAGALGVRTGTSDPDRAERNLRERDLRLARHVAERCADLGLRCVEVDRSRDVDDSLALLEEHFRPHLPATLNV